MKKIMNIADRHARALGLLLAAVLAALTAALNVSRGPLSNLNDIGGWTNRMAFIALAAAAHAAVLGDAGAFEPEGIRASGTETGADDARLSAADVPHQSENAALYGTGSAACAENGRDGAGRRE